MDRYFILSPESSAEPGRWSTLSYQRGIMEAVTDPEVREISVMKSARVGYTKILDGTIGYHMHQDPCSILMVQPVLEDSEGYSKDEIAPMLRDVKVLTDLVGDPKARDSGRTIGKIQYPGGVLTITGANTGRAFRRLTVRKVLYDEVDAYPSSAGNEGDPIELGKKRAMTAWNSQFLYGSSPKLKGSSRIEALWFESDQRDYYVPCPECQHLQRLQWGSKDADYGIKWDRDDPDTAYYLCVNCHSAIPQSAQVGMVDEGTWISAYDAEEQGLKEPDSDHPANPFTGHAGFRIWAAYSPFANARWSELVREFLRCKDNPLLFQVFVNTILGESWEDRYTAVPSGLQARAYPFPKQSGGTSLVPRAVAVQTAAIDQQADRLECTIVGWGREEEAWVLQHRIFYGDPSTLLLWTEVWSWLIEPWPMERGGVDYVRALCVDTGGLFTNTAYDFCRPRFLMPTPDGRKRFTFALKGSAGQAATLWPREPYKSPKGKLPVYTVKVDIAKDALSTRLQRAVVPGPGYIHFPDTLGEEYFKQLTAEKAVVTYDRKGFLIRAWEKKSAGARNEAWDLLVYNMAALEGLKAMGYDHEKEVDAVGRLVSSSPAGAEEAPDSAAERVVPVKKHTKRRRISRWDRR